MFRFSSPLKLMLWIAILLFQQSTGFVRLTKKFRQQRPSKYCPSRNVLKMALSATAPVETLTIAPIKSLDGTVTLPGSKSLSNRCLLLAALSEGNTRVDNLLESDDIRYMLEALDMLEVPVERHSAESVTVSGQGEIGRAHV